MNYRMAKRLDNAVGRLNERLVRRIAEFHKDDVLLSAMVAYKLGQISWDQAMEQTAIRSAMVKHALRKRIAELESKGGKQAKGD